MSQVTLVPVLSDLEWTAYHSLRRRVLFEARGYTHYDPLHPDETKQGAYPLLLKEGERFIGTVRLDHAAPRVGIVRMLAVAEAEQGKGYGRVLEALVCDKARALGVKTLYVNGAKDAISYYLHLGWQFFVWDEEERRTFMHSGGRQLKKEL